MRFYKLRESIVIEEIFLKKVHISENGADMLTKPDPKDKFKHYLDLVFVPCDSPQWYSGGEGGVIPMA